MKQVYQSKNPISLKMLKPLLGCSNCADSAKFKKAKALEHSTLLVVKQSGRFYAFGCEWL